MLIYFLFVVLIICSFVYTKLKVPAKLQHIPSRPILDFIQDFLANKSLYNRIEDLCLQQMQKTRVMLIWSLGDWYILVSSKEVAKKLHSDTDTYPKLLFDDVNSSRLLSKFLGEAILFSNGSSWKKHRKVINSIFKKQFSVETFVDATRQFFNVLELNNFKVDVHKYMQCITMESMGRDIMGVQFNLILNDNVPFIKAYNTMIEEIGNPFYFLFPKLDASWNPLRKKGFEALEELDKYFQQILQQKKSELVDNCIEDSKLDLLSLLIKAGQESDGEFSEIDIRNNVMNFILAGHDTTAFALSAALHFLAENPEVQEKARSEILEVVGYSSTYCTADTAKAPTLEQTKRMTYLLAIIKETMRIYPAVIRLPERITTKDVQLDNYFIPKGTGILFDIYCLHHDPQYFENPEQFIPERFVQKDASKNEVEETWLPFGGGTRSCIGNNFSLLEQKVVLSMILARYRISKSTFQMKPSFLPVPSDFTLKFELL